MSPLHSIKVLLTCVLTISNLNKTSDRENIEKYLSSFSHQAAGMSLWTSFVNARMRLPLLHIAKSLKKVSSGAFYSFNLKRAREVEI